MKKHNRQEIPSTVNEQRKRNDILDIAKGIGMLFVVFAHVNKTPNILVLIYSFHMPLFFFLSGVVFHNDKYVSFRMIMRSRVKELVVPYFFFSLVALALMFVVDYGIPVFQISKTLDWYLYKLMHIFLAERSNTLFNVPLWFIPCLFVIEIMYFFISKLSTRNAVLLCVILTIFGWFLESGYLNFDNTVFPWSIDSALFSLGFFAIGNIVKGHLLDAIEYMKGHKRKKYICFGVFFLLLVVWYPLALMNGKISIGSKILNNGFLLYATGILGTLGIIVISILCEKSKLLKYIGKNSFCIMATHWLVMLFVNSLYTMLGIKRYNEVVFGETILPFFIIFALSIFVTMVYNVFKKRKIFIIW